MRGSALGRAAPPALPPLAYLKSGKTCPKSAKPGETLSSESEAEIVAMDDGRAPLGRAVPSWDRDEMVPRGESNPHAF